MDTITDYNDDIETLFLQYFITDPELYTRCRGIVNSDHYENTLNKKVVDFLQKYSDEYSTLPTTEQIKAITGKKLTPLAGMNDKHKEWLLDNYEKFARHKEMETAILSAPDMLEQGRYGEVEAKIKAAILIGLVKDLGTDYFKNPTERLETILNSRGAISTGWKDVDDKLYGGFNRGEITIFAGQSGAGKSLFLQNLAINWVQLGLNVVYITLELSENLCSLRLDAIVTSYGTKEVLKNKDDVAMRLAAFQKKHKGSLLLKQLPNGCTANDIRAFIKEYEIQSGIRVDAVLVDYLDLCMPMSRKVSPSDLFVKDKYVSEELRNMASDLDVLLATASQLNRGSHDEVVFDHSHISGGISKINTADNVIAIFTTQAMKENGRYQVQFMKTRSSSGVGSSVDLAFDQKSLKISDLPQGAAGSQQAQTSAIMKKLQNNGAVTTPKTNPVARKPASSTDTVSRVNNLRDLMKKLD